jgi:peptidoglycan/xylan/chitin deacetylase (PgdA/CDA1 family)
MYNVIRRNIRHLLLDILSFYSVPKSGIHILNGHFLSLDNTKSADIFKRLLDYLIKNNIVLINIQEACIRIINHDFPTEKCYVAFTFDDGFEECYTKLAPIFNSYGLKGAFFINPAFVDGDTIYCKTFLNDIVCTNSDKKSLNWEQINELHKQGHIIGSHTLNHVNLKVFEEKHKYEIIESKRIIESKLNAKCDYFAYPYGRISQLSEEALKIAKDHYKYIFSQGDHKHYYSFNGQVINRRHFECEWPKRHVLYFLQKKESGL